MRHGGAILTYTLHIQFGWFEVTYNHFRWQLGPHQGLQGGQQRELVVLPTIVLSGAYVFLLCPLARNPVERWPRAVSVCQSAGLTVTGWVAKAYA